MKDKPNVFIVCTGLGHINRGYESFTKECFFALKDVNEFELYVLKGGGKLNKKEIRISCAQRDSKTASFLAKIVGMDTYWIEQFTFLICMLPAIIKLKPAVIYYSDFVLGTFLYHLRRFVKFKYKLLFSNGAPNGPPFKTEDHVQQLLPVYMNKAIEDGAPAAMQTLLPYGFDINVDQRLNSFGQSKSMRAKLGLPEHKKIILSVGAINKTHKRMDYVINEIEKLPDNYFLVILGQFEAESPELIEMASQKLPDRYLMINVPSDEVKNYYIAADYFVLSSLIEGFGRVLIEALSYGLPCIVHDYINSKQVLKEYGTYINMQEPGALSKKLLVDTDLVKNTTRIKAAYNLYSWNELSNKYSTMITSLINS